MNNEEWRIELSLDNDNCGLCIEDITAQESLPVIPRRGEIVWKSEQCVSELTEKIKACWREHECSYCPYNHGQRKSEVDIDVSDYIYVSCVVYDVDEQRVLIGLSNTTRLYKATIECE